MIRVKLVRSLIGTHPKIRKTALALGLRRIGREKIFRETPSIKGMLKVVEHIVEVGEVNE